MATSGALRLASCVLPMLAMGCLDAPESAEAPDDPPAVSGPAVAVEARPTAGVMGFGEVALPVTGCHAGGASTGLTIAYAEQNADIRTRSFDVLDYDVELADLLDLPPEPAALGIDVGAAFGVDPEGTVSSADDESLLSTIGFVPAGAFGVFYRQTLEVRRPAAIVAITDLGDEYVIGEILLSDWDFRADVGTGSSCPPFPPAPDTLSGG